MGWQEILMAYGVTLIMIKHLGFFRGDVCSQFLRPRPYLRASETRHKAVVSKFIVSQARPHQKTQLFFFKGHQFRMRKSADAASLVHDL